VRVPVGDGEACADADDDVLLQTRQQWRERRVDVPLDVDDATVSTILPSWQDDETLDRSHAAYHSYLGATQLPQRCWQVIVVQAVLFVVPAYFFSVVAFAVAAENDVVVFCAEAFRCTQ
jgi:hypothetical protein